MKATTTIFFFLCSFGLFSQCLSGRCKNGFGKYRYNSGLVYEGNFEKGLRQGQGIAIFSDGLTKYEGEWKNDDVNGKGTMIYKEGHKYTGDWVANERTGKGTMEYKSGAKYSGDWVNGNRQGIGSYTKVGEGKYEGSWYNDFKNGKGTMSYANGDIYEGEWINNERTGLGSWMFTGNANKTFEKSNSNSPETNQATRTIPSLDVSEPDVNVTNNQSTTSETNQATRTIPVFDVWEPDSNVTNNQSKTSQNSQSHQVINSNNNSLTTESSTSSVTCIEGDCFNGYGKYLTQYSDVYDTYDMNFSVVDSRDIDAPAKKKANVNYDIDYRYEGDFVDGKFSGQGKMYDQSGNLQYEGIWNYGVLITSQRINVDSPKKKAYLNKKAEEERKYQVSQTAQNSQSHQQNEKVGEQILNNGKPQQQPKEEKLVIEPASIGAKWTSAKYINTYSTSRDRGILTKTGNSTFTFKWVDANEEVKTEYLTLKSSKEGMCHDVEIEEAMNELAIRLGQEPQPKKGKCRICQYTIKGNADRKVIINWLSGGVDIEVELYDDFGSLIRSWRLSKE